MSDDVKPDASEQQVQSPDRRQFMKIAGVAGTAGAIA